MKRKLFFILCFIIYIPQIHAQSDSAKVYSVEHPLIFEDSWNLWPYSFLNEKGEPEGYCIDLFRIIMRELDIPYVIQLKPHQEALKDLKAEEADLTLGLYDVYGVEFGLSGKNSIVLLTQSAVTPKNKPVAIKTFRDLKSQQVIVKDSGLCHQLMVDYGWGDRAIASTDIGKDIQAVSDKGEGQIVWNTLSLKWLIDHYQLDNLALTPVNMPFGERKFMSNDQHLLDLIDKTYLNLCAEGKLASLEEKWFYPEHKDTTHPWVWYLAGGALLMLVMVIAFLVHELRQNRKSTATYHQLSQQLSQVAEHNKVRFWTYHIEDHKFVWHDESGMEVSSYSAEAFAKRYNKEDFAQLKEALERLITPHMDAKGHEEKEETLELKAKDTEFGDGELHGFVIHLSVLSRDIHGKPTVIIGTKKDVSKERQLKQINAERSLRYLSMFYNNKSGILYFDKEGFMQNANTKASELLRCDIDKAVMKHTHLNSLFNTAFTDLEDANGTDGKLMVDNQEISYHMKAVYNDEKKLLGLFVFCI